jgi:hypothetical protein
MFTQSQKRSRGEALVEAFFFRMDQELVNYLRRNLEREEKLRTFALVTGIKKPKVVESLVEAGFEISTLTAFTWAPTIFVAWADGRADKLEKIAILDAFTGKGVSQETASMMLSHSWFASPPSEEIWTIWEEFASAWLADLTSYNRTTILDEIVDLCYIVAHASGGLLGLGKVSQSESDVIDRIIKQQVVSTIDTD